MPDTATPDRTKLRSEIRRAHRRKVKADTTAEEARRELYRLAAEANAAGVTLEEIGEDLGGLSKQRVSDVVREVRATR